MRFQPTSLHSPHKGLTGIAEMNWKPRISWALLAVLVALAGWRLTVLVTHVDRRADSTVEIVYGEQPPTRMNLRDLSVSAVQKERDRIPGIVVSGSAQVLMLVTASSRSFTLNAGSALGLSCSYSNRVFERTTPLFLVEMARNGPLLPFPVTQTAAGSVFVSVPAALHTALAHKRSGHGIILCTFSKPLAARPTFTDRSLTITVLGLSGIFLFDVSALQDIDNLRFSGGVSFPLAGERTRFLVSTDNIVSVEWTDVTASERRDIVLVIVGALAAISAAMAIEAIRPFIER